MGTLYQISAQNGRLTGWISVQTLSEFINSTLNKLKLPLDTPRRAYPLAVPSPVPSSLLGGASTSRVAETVNGHAPPASSVKTILTPFQSEKCLAKTTCRLLMSVPARVRPPPLFHGLAHEKSIPFSQNKGFASKRCGAIPLLLLLGVAGLALRRRA